MVGNTIYHKDIETFKNSGIILQKENFYDKIKEKTFTEYLGVYYQDEVQAGGGKVETPDADRIPKRVITYVQNNP